MQYNNKNLNDNTISLYSTNYSDNKKKNKKILRVFDMNGEKNIIKDLENSNNNSDIEGKKLINDFFKIYNIDKKNAMKNRINFCKKLNRKKLNNKIIDEIDKFIDDKSPGPGYYFDKICMPLKYSKIQNYFTKEKRFHHLKKPWTQLGPGEYFNIDKNYTQDIINKKYITHKDIPFGSNEKRNNTFLGLENTRNNPGPGNYEFRPFTKDIENEGHPRDNGGFPSLKALRYRIQRRFSRNQSGKAEPQVATFIQQVHLPVQDRSESDRMGETDAEHFPFQRRIIPLV